MAKMQVGRIKAYLPTPCGKEDERQRRGAGDAAAASPSSADVSALVTLIECNCLLQILLKPFQSPPAEIREHR